LLQSPRKPPVCPADSNKHQSAIRYSRIPIGTHGTWSQNRLDESIQFVRNVQEQNKAHPYIDLTQALSNANRDAITPKPSNSDSISSSHSAITLRAKSPKTPPRHGVASYKSGSTMIFRKCHHYRRCNPTAKRQTGEPKGNTHRVGEQTKPLKPSSHYARALAEAVRSIIAIDQYLTGIFREAK